MNLLEYLQLFHSISPSDFNLLIADFKHKKFDKGEYITEQGQVQKHLYFITKGVQMSFLDSDNRMHVIAFTYPPNLCAIPESFMLQQPAPYALKCLTETEANYISYDNLQELFDRSQNIERLFRKMTEAILAGMINRHMELHSLSIEERFKTFVRRSPQLLHLIPHKYIASYLGIDATNFSKLYNTIKI